MNLQLRQNKAEIRLSRIQIEIVARKDIQTNLFLFDWKIFTS